MSTIDDQVKECHDHNGSQRLKAPGNKGYFCKYSCGNDNVSCEAFDASRTHYFGPGGEYYGCRKEELFIPEFNKERALPYRKRRKH